MYMFIIFYIVVTEILWLHIIIEYIKLFHFLLVKSNLKKRTLNLGHYHKRVGLPWAFDTNKNCGVSPFVQGCNFSYLTYMLGHYYSFIFCAVFIKKNVLK